MTFIPFILIAPLLTNQQHGEAPSATLFKMMGQLAFMKGDWVGTQSFNMQGQKLDIPATNSVKDAIGGRYFEETLTTTMPGQPTRDVRHFLSYDQADGKYKSYWFNDTQTGPMELDGSVSGNELTLESPPEAKNHFKAIYKSDSGDSLSFELWLKQGSDWNRLFTATYKRR